MHRPFSGINGEVHPSTSPAERGLHCGVVTSLYCSANSIFLTVQRHELNCIVLIKYIFSFGDTFVLMVLTICSTSIDISTNTYIVGTMHWVIGTKQLCPYNNHTIVNKQIDV